LQATCGCHLNLSVASCRLARLDVGSASDRFDPSLTGPATSGTQATDTHLTRVTSQCPTGPRTGGTRAAGSGGTRRCSTAAWSPPHGGLCSGWRRLSAPPDLPASCAHAILVLEHMVEEHSSRMGFMHFDLPSTDIHASTTGLTAMSGLLSSSASIRDVWSQPGMI